MVKCIIDIKKYLRFIVKIEYGMAKIFLYLLLVITREFIFTNTIYTASIPQSITVVKTRMQNEEQESAYAIQRARVLARQEGRAQGEAEGRWLAQANSRQNALFVVASITTVLFVIAIYIEFTKALKCGSGRQLRDKKLL